MRTVLVTGGNRGIGLAIVKQLAACSEDTILLGCRNLEQGQAEAQGMGNHVQAVQLELSDEKRDPLSNQFDVTLRIGKPESNPALIEHDITYTSRRIVASPDFLAKYGEPTEVSQLATLPCLQ